MLMYQKLEDLVRLFVISKAHSFLLSDYLRKVESVGHLENVDRRLPMVNPNVAQTYLTNSPAVIGSVTFTNINGLLMVDVIHLM